MGHPTWRVWASNYSGAKYLVASLDSEAESINWRNEHGVYDDFAQCWVKRNDRTQQLTITAHDNVDTSSQ